MNASSTTNSLLPTTKQFMGVESTNTTRLLALKSWKAEIINHPVDRTWIVEKANHRTYLQQKVSLQQLKIWNTFRTIPQDVTLVDANDPSNIDFIKPITVYAGNWDHDSLANFLNSEWASQTPPITQTITWDPYQLRFILCPPMDISRTSTINKFLGFPGGETIWGADISEFPPVELYGIPYINIHTNFTMNNIPVSEYLCSIPITVPYGQHVFYFNSDPSMSTLVLDPDITNVRVILTDHKGNLLEYSEELDWEIVLSMQATLPEGFAPLEM